MAEKIQPIGGTASEAAAREALQSQWVSMERYRLEVVRTWPPSAYKEATLAAIYSTLASLAPANQSAASVERPLALAA